MAGKGKTSVIDDIFATAKEQKERKKKEEEENRASVAEAEAQKRKLRENGEPSGRVGDGGGAKKRSKQKKQRKDGDDRKGEAFVAAAYSKDRDDVDLNSLLPRYKRKKTNEGFAIYSEKELRINQGGGTDFLGERDGGEGATTSGAPGPSSWVSDVGAILRFALPALGSSLASPVLSAVDTAVVGRCATTLELAALGPASTVFDSLGLVFAFLQVASINKLAGLAGGEGETAAERRREAVSEFAALSVVLGVVLMLGLLLFAGPLMAATTNAASSEAIAPAALYTRVRALSVPAFIAQITAQGILMGLSRDSVSPLLAVLLGGALNTAGDLVLVGWLRWGIAGAAAATVAAQCATSAFLALRVAAELGRGGEGGRKRSIKLPVLVDLAPLVVESLPFLAMKLLTCVKVFLMNYLSTMFGSASLAAHLVALTIWRCLILVGEPLSFAAQSFAPQHFARQGGEGRGLYYVKLVLGIGAGVSVAMLAATLTAYAPLTRLFTYDPATLSAARSVSAQVALSVCVFPVLLSLEGSLLAIGRVRDLVLAMASNVAFMLMGWWVLHVKGGESLKGVWTVFSGMHSFYAAVMLAMVAGTLMAARGSRLEKL